MTVNILWIHLHVIRYYFRSLIPTVSHRFPWMVPHSLSISYSRIGTNIRIIKTDYSCSSKNICVMENFPHVAMEFTCLSTFMCLRCQLVYQCSLFFSIVILLNSWYLYWMDIPFFSKRLDIKEIYIFLLIWKTLLCPSW